MSRSLSPLGPARHFEQGLKAPSFVEPQLRQRAIVMLKRRFLPSNDPAHLPAGLRELRNWENRYAPPVRWSGKETPLPASPPLRTGRAPCDAYGSSLPERPSQDAAWFISLSFAHGPAGGS